MALRPYAEWLTDYPGRLLLLASAEELNRHGERLPSAGYAHAEAVTDYDSRGHVEAIALTLARSTTIDHVIACQELDLQRAAVLRQILGLTGQKIDSADCFRDKLLMKRRAVAAGIPVAPHAEITTAVDVLAFVRDFGFPVVLKPRDGLSSIGLSVIRDEAALAHWFDTDFDLYQSERTILIEAFVPGAMYHVDGMIIDGRMAIAWPSQYLYQLAGFDQADTGPRLDATLDIDDPLTGQLLAFAEAVIAALPSPGCSTFHAEIFRTPDDDLVLCEIASRNGGALIKYLLKALFGVDFPIAWVRTSLDLPVPELAFADAARPARMAGQVLLPKRAGVVRQVPEQAPFEWVEHYEPFVQPGDRLAGSSSSGDYMAGMVVFGPTRVICEQRMRQAAQWLDAALLVDAVQPSTNKDRTETTS
jgi:biotin carboxylase